MFDLIAFDADDTLWHNETLYAAAQEQFKRLLAGYHDPEWIQRQLDQTEGRNLALFGYGIKSFALSMIETAIELSEGRIPASDIQKIVGFARDMLQTPVELLEHATETVARLAQAYELMILTKGDLRDQQVKLARSGLAGYFKYVEIVSEKTDATYRAVWAKYRVAPARFLMVGNSLRSDILPVVALGGQAVYIPFQLTWVHEHAAAPQAEDKRYYELEHIGLLPALLESLQDGQGRSN